MIRATVDRATLLALIERVRTRMELHADEHALRGDLEQLDRWLIAPVRDRLGAAGTPLVIIADGDVAAVPFAALRAPSTSRYLIEDHPIRLTTSLADAAERTTAMATPRSAVLIADPAFDRREHPELSRLAAAEGEVDRIAAIYRSRSKGTRVLGDTGAGRAAVTHLVAGADVVHYAGHALFDDERPARSFLLLARDTSTAPGADRLSAGEIEHLDLRTVQLVVLSACETSRPTSVRSGGFAGLAGAFLAAGARGVIGSLWRVDDRLTTPVMVALHDAYAASGDPVAALRSAQLFALHSSDPGLRTPSAWAGFRYTGR
jgi:CHAT domain-containing protein